MISAMKSRRTLALENLALRQQVVMLKRSVKRAKPTTADRVFWIVFARILTRWRELLFALNPDTIIRWHREGFRRYWTRKCRRAGRPPIDPELRLLIRRMQAENRTWGAPRVHGELLKLGFTVSEATVSKYMKRVPKPPSQSWRIFLDNHREAIAAIDFFTVPTATFRILYVFIVIEHSRRQILHFNVTEHPTAQWTVQQLTEAFPFDSVPRYLLRDGDAIYGERVQRRIAHLNIQDLVTTPASPWKNAYAERVIGSIRRECLNHTIVLSEKHLRRVLKEYVRYYNESRTHLGLAKDPPKHRPIEPPGRGTVVALPVLGGLHHRYTRLAA